MSFDVREAGGELQFTAHTLLPVAPAAHAALSLSLSVASSPPPPHGDIALQRRLHLKGYSFNASTQALTVSAEL